MSDPAELERIHLDLQRIILRLAEDRVSDDPQEVRAELARRIVDAGHAVPPDKWLTDTALDISAGGLVVMDAEVARKVEQSDDHESPTGLNQDEDQPEEQT